MKNSKKSLNIFLTFALVMGIISALTVSASAHDSDTHKGTVPFNTTALRLNLTPSALPAGGANGINMSWYTHVRTKDIGWNHLSSRVNIADLWTNLSGANVVNVYGKHYAPIPIGGGEYLHYLGLTEPKVKVGVTELNAGMNDNWSSVSITMNTNMDAWYYEGANYNTARQRFEKSFIHEVGHLFKLAHPTCNSFAVMRQGYPVKDVALTVAAHDRSNLRNRWGF